MGCRGEARGGDMTLNRESEEVSGEENVGYRWDFKVTTGGIETDAICRQQICTNYRMIRYKPVIGLVDKLQGAVFFYTLMNIQRGISRKAFSVNRV